MPLRFRKSIKILPGVKLNFSKSGISTSLGGRGGSVNFGKRGVRTTVGVPGTGISFSKQVGSPKPAPAQRARLQFSATDDQPAPNISSQDDGRFKRLWKWSTAKPANAIVSILSTIVLCCCGTTFLGMTIGALDGGITPTPSTYNTPRIQQTLGLPTETRTARPTKSPFPTQTVRPTITLIPTSTPFVYLSPTIGPTTGPASAVCPCSGDTLNCSDFGSQSSAQACYNYCVSLGVGDIHNLDRDGNGLACESN